MTPRIGDPAPDFTLRDQHGRRTSLGDFRGERPVVVMFYPFAFSGVCTGELHELRDHGSRLTDAGATLLAVSCDPMFALRVFADQDRLEFPLLSDFWPHGAVAQEYGAFDPDHGCPTRSTFIVDADGVLRWQVHNPMGEARSLDDYVRAIGSLRGAK
jgi:peroxiredoxin